jgi:hypothetical protein
MFTARRRERSDTVLTMTPKKRPAWQWVLLSVLAGYALFYAVVLFLAFWWDFLPQSIWFVAPILLIILGLTWLARQGIITPRVVLTTSVWLVGGAMLTAVVYFTGISGQPLVGYLFLAMGLTTTCLIRWQRRSSLG